MIDAVIPKGNEEELADMAVKLGYGSLCFLYEKPEATDIELAKKISSGKGLKAHIGSLNPGRNAEITFYDVCGRDIAMAVHEKKAEVLFNFELVDAKDRMHQRLSGLDPALCSLMSQKRKVYCLDFGKILGMNKASRSVILGRIKQNLMLCRKYKIDVAIASFASTAMGMRNPLDLSAFLAVLGCDAGKKPLEAIERKIELNRKRKEGVIIAEGVERVTGAAHI